LLRNIVLKKAYFKKLLFARDCELNTPFMERVRVLDLKIRELAIIQSTLS